MAARLKLAALGHTMERGKVVEWYVSEGAEVVQGAPLFAVETDKAVVDVEAPAGGVLLRIDAPVNKEYPVGATLAWIGDSGEVLPDKMDETIAAPEAVSGEQRVTPVARRLAERHGVDADRLDGTGPGGRVTKEDVKRAIDAGTAPALERKAQSKASGEPPHDVVPLTWIRRVTAERLSAHWTCAPQVTEGVDIDMTEVRAWRTAKRDEWRAAFGIMPSLNDIVLKAVAVALEAHPTLNSAFVDGSIHRYREINLGVAVDVEDGLVVPVLHNAGRLDLGGIASAVADFTTRAKARKLTLEDIDGATFTVSNLSALGVDWFTPVLNPPQCALLGMGRMRRTPAAVGREVLIRDIATFVLTFDHRALDGAPAARFLARLKRLLESPDTTLSK
jgi:pyruvate dehydrogenase E2 component (dihydrolipoamide acetyltransferase)